jgi:hypothetical protein
MPFYRFHVDVALSPTDASERLEAEISQYPGFGESFLNSWRSWILSEQSEYFVGRIHDRRFQISLVNPRRRNPFAPAIRGKITPSGRGARVDVVMYIDPFVAVFMASWFFGCFQMLGRSMSLKLLGSVLVFVVGGAVFFLISFFDVALKARKMLTSILLREETRVVIDAVPDERIRCNGCGHFNAIKSIKCLYCGAEIARRG